MPQEWAGIANSTIHKYIREEEIEILRNRKVTALLQDRGRVTFNHSGDAVEWPVRFMRAPMSGYADSDTLTFSKRNRRKKALLDWRGYASTESLTKLDTLKNRGTEAIVKLLATTAPSLMQDMEDQFGDELYKDGNLAANIKGIHGLESMFSTSGAKASGYVGSPNDTYAGLVTTLGNYGGSWSEVASVNNWPDGTGDAHYDFWTPLVVDYTDTAWSATTKTWPNTCEEALAYGIIEGRRNKSKRGMLDIILVERKLFREFTEAQRLKEGISVVRGQSMGSNKGRIYDLGFTDVFNFEGVDLTTEYGLPTGVGYGICINDLELMSMQENLFVPGGPVEDETTQSIRFWIDFFGNLKIASPRNFVKWVSIT